MKHLNVLQKTISNLAERLRVMIAMSLRVNASWALTSIARSSAKLLKSDEQRRNQIRKNVTLISMVKNEKNIMETFCAHALSLFDRIILVDHLSTDGTREYIKLISTKHSCIEYYSFEETGYYQSELMTWIARNVAHDEMSGWVFFLDADEFLPFKSKEEFDRKLSDLSFFPVISMPWLNLIPLNMDSGRVIGEFFLKPPKSSCHCKIAFQPNLIPLDDYVVAQGNHSLLMGSEFSQRLPVKNAFPIYHLPIRTKQQLREKILHGVESYRSMGKDRATNLGFHWEEIYRIMQTSSLTNEMMAGIAAKYGEPLSPPYERNLNKLRENGYSEMRMDVCFSQPVVSFDDIEFCVADEIKKIPVSSAFIPTQSKGYRKIILDPLTHSLRFSR